MGGKGGKVPKMVISHPLIANMRGLNNKKQNKKISDESCYFPTHGTARTISNYDILMAKLKNHKGGHFILSKFLI